MYYKQKPKTYPGRGFVHIIQGLLIAAIVFVVADGLIDRFNKPQTMERAASTTNYGWVELNEPHVEAAPVERAYSVYELFDIALDYHLEDDYYAAIDYYTRTIEADDTYAVPFLNRGVAYEQTGQAFRSMNDLWTYIQKNSTLTMTRLDFQPGQTLQVEMAQGRAYVFPFKASYGDVITISAFAEAGDIVDPVVVLVDQYDRPVVSNDDIIVNGQLQSMNAFIRDFPVPHDCMGEGAQTYKLVVHHAGGGSYGTVNVSVNVR